MFEKSNICIIQSPLPVSTFIVLSAAAYSLETQKMNKTFKLQNG